MYHAVEMGWTVSDHKLTDLIDLTKWLVWAKSKDAETGRNKPKPEPRPTDGADKKTTAAAGESVASVMSIAEFNKRRARGIKRWRKRRGLDVKEE